MTMWDFLTQHPEHLEKIIWYMSAVLVVWACKS